MSLQNIVIETKRKYSVAKKQVVLNDGNGTSLIIYKYNIYDQKINIMHNCIVDIPYCEFWEIEQSIAPLGPYHRRFLDRFYLVLAPGSCDESDYIFYCKNATDFKSKNREFLLIEPTYGSIDRSSPLKRADIAEKMKESFLNIEKCLHENVSSFGYEFSSNLHDRIIKTIAKKRKLKKANTIAKIELLSGFPIIAIKPIPTKKKSRSVNASF